MPVLFEMLRRYTHFFISIVTLSLLVVLFIPMSAAAASIEGENGYFRRDELPPPRLNTDPTKLLVIEQGRIFYNGNELRMEGECRRKEWAAILGEPDRVNDARQWINQYWDQLGLIIGCRWVKADRKVYRSTAIIAHLRFRTYKNPDLEPDWIGLHGLKPFPGYMLIDGVALTPEVTYDHYLRQRTTRHFMNIRSNIADLPAQHSVYQSRAYDVCKPHPLEVDIGWQANRNHIDYRRIYRVSVANKVWHYQKRQCKDTPFSNYVTENCDADCAERRGLAAISLFKRLLPHGAADQRDEAAEKHGLKDAPTITKQSQLMKLEQDYTKMAASERSLVTRMKAFYTRFQHLIATEANLQLRSKIE